MPHRTPLTAARLAELYDQEPSPVVRELLWEIHRLRALVLRVGQVRQSISDSPPWVPPFLWDTLMSELDAEPCLHDPPTPRQLRWRGHAFQDVEEDSGHTRENQ
jgi:hypothetical protein